MADEAPTTRFHLHRRFNMAPFRRFAFTVEYDNTASSGYKIVDHDPIVADAAYLAKFDTHMGKPQHAVASGGIYRGVAYTDLEDLPPGSINHYTTAVRNFGAAVMPHGRNQ